MAFRIEIPAVEDDVNADLRRQRAKRSVAASEPTRRTSEADARSSQPIKRR